MLRDANNTMIFKYLFSSGMRDRGILIAFNLRFITFKIFHDNDWNFLETRILHIWTSFDFLGLLNSHFHLPGKFDISCGQWVDVYRLHFA